MKIGLLQTGDVNQNLVAEFGEYPDMFKRMLGAVDQGLSFTTYSIVNGVFPQSIEECDGWLVTGSRHGVYDALPWMEPLKEFLRTAHAKRAPIIGVCFGHQILAEALGGKVEKSAKGWGVGVHRYELSFSNEPEPVKLYAMHQDQVISPPAEARVIARSEFCEYAGLAYGANAMSLQPHPEFGRDFTEALLNIRRGRGVPEDVADKAAATFSEGVDAPRVAQWMAAFFRSAHLARATQPAS